MATIPKYVLQRSFDIDPSVWAAAKNEIRTILIDAARERTMIPYSELVGRVNVEQMVSTNGVHFGHHLFAKS